MLDSIGWGEILVLVIAGLFILGPERLPSAAAWLGRTVRQVRDYATGAREQLRSELGPEFDDLRKPLEDLRGIRDFDPRRAVSKHLLDGENPLDGITNDRPSRHHGNGHSRPSDPPSSDNTGRQSLNPGERPPFDADTT
ncbi:sec-independent protein translocase protein TatB [Halopolyspora algeriensis]|uniref:Sec-independent protein translocase protein TatB n=1 Tax=Halopolyspora algeriensis TaxID=1500506 RepID=A0A368VMQ5_9ACTN|nr:Sec-independent protein translocase protein TatB [Halopolyspora algeriensis]RCW42790.1 sec-independent protein translocase protein TatB [Halopolyspora algeriensis]TQM56740.1 sec-independent protein translocase protein TatB [Halopolyspora algeriensis]